MAQKPTVEELERKIKEEEKKALEEKQAAEALARKNAELNSFINNIPDMAWVKDVDSRFIAVNRAFGGSVGMDPEYLIHQTCEVCFGKKEAEKFREDDLKVMEGRKQKIIEEKIIDSQKNEVWLETIKSPILDESGNVIGTVGIARDITKRKRTEEELSYKTVLLEAQSEASIDGILVIDNKGNVVSFNERMREMWNVPQEIWDSGDDEKLLQHAITLLKNPDEFLERVRYLYAHKDKKSRDEIELKDGRYFDRYSSPLIDQTNKYHGRIWFFRDITNRKKAEGALEKLNLELEDRVEQRTTELSKANMLLKRKMDELKQTDEALRESEERFKNLANLLPQPVWETDLEGNFTYTNWIGYESLGYTPKDLEEGVSVVDIIAAEDRERVFANFSKMLRGIEFDNHEYTCLTKDGRKFPALIYSSPVIKDGEQSGIRGVTLDITELKHAEEQAKASLKEKEILLQEIHHRVKNNLAVISSLLSMQANIVMDRNIHSALQESQSRVNAMALIHETLYQSESLALVDLESYVKDLISNIVNAFDGITGRTNFEIEVRDVKLEVSQAMPCGLIINELATNALRHAFIDGQKGVVRITAGYAEDKEVELTVRDNGIGFSEELDWKKSKSLGLRLISLMVDQLHGTLDIRNHNGTEITIKWPVQVT